MPEPKFTREISLVTVKAMIIEAGDRLGDENPYADIAINDLSDQELFALRRSLHELLYAPPRRS